jgi:hypothetical protein
LIQAFLSSEITAFQLDRGLDDFRCSDDPVIRHVVHAIWFRYDDCDDHVVCLSKDQWDYIQRLLLILASDCRVETQTERRWTVKQLIAAVSLCVFAGFALKLGWGHHLLIVAMPFGFVSMALSRWHRRSESSDDPYESIIYPFATFSDLATAYYSSTFRKTQYPRHLEDRSIRSPFMSAFWQLYFYTTWLLFSPVPLLFQSLPERQSRTRFRAA